MGSDTAGLTLDEAARKLQVRDARGVQAIQRLEAIEAGETEPSRALLTRMAKHYRRPLLTFYLSAPPLRGDRGQDFRTLPDDRSEEDEAVLDALIRDVRARQSLLRAAIEDEEEAEPLAFVGSMRLADGVTAVQRSIQSVLDLHIDEFYAARTVDAAFNMLRARSESAGIFILLAGNLGSHHTNIAVEAFRGFTLADPIAPFIIVNDQDARSAWAFTLLHELTHLWLGQTGVSGGVPSREIERFCNDVASDYLLPDDELRSLRIARPWEVEAASATIDGFATPRNLSRSMVAYRLFRRGSITSRQWDELRDRFRQEWLASRERRRETNREQAGGANFYVVRRHRLGSHLIDSAARLMAAGALTTSKAARVLGLRPQQMAPLLATSGPLTRAS